MSGLSRLPVRSRGAARSIASRMAVSAIAAGVTITEVRAVGLQRRRPRPAPAAVRRTAGESQLMAKIAPPKKMTAITALMAILAQGKRLEDG